jgi:hypothetical protein
MSEFILRIDTSNDAFIESPTYEVAQILENVARRVTTGKKNGVVWDSNGNKVGTFTELES